jgi:hypothetical protein
MSSLASCSYDDLDASTCSVGWDCSASSLCGELIVEIYVNKKHVLYCISNSLDLDRSHVESPRGLKPIIHWTYIYKRIGTNNTYIYFHTS